MSCVFGKKSKRENTKQKLVGVCREENWAWEEESEQKNPRCGCRRREASRKAHSGSLSIGRGEKSGRGRKKTSGKINNQYLKYWLLFESNDIVWSAI